jgi:hypothetical protein
VHVVAAGASAEEALGRWGLTALSTGA